MVVLYTYRENWQIVACSFVLLLFSSIVIATSSPRSFDISITSLLWAGIASLLT